MRHKDLQLPQWAFHHAGSQQLLTTSGSPSPAHQGHPQPAVSPPWLLVVPTPTREPLSGSVTGTGHTPGFLQITGQTIFSLEQSTTGVRWKTIWKGMTGQAKVVASQLERNRSTGFGEEEGGTQVCSAYLRTYRGKEDVFSRCF